MINGLKKIIGRLRSYCILRMLMRDSRPLDTGVELIRIGCDSDGGYLIPNDLDGIVACYSPGVDLISSFELECAKQGIQVYLADGSVESPAETHELFDFRKVFLSGVPMENSITLNEWVEETSADDKGDLILQMDIEGHEYDVLTAVSIDLMKRFRIMVIEFHSLTYLTPLMYKVFKKILNTHYCVHIHPNNCSPPEMQFGTKVSEYMEFSFHRKDRAESIKNRTDFPHYLDKDNTDQDSVILPKSWYNW